MSPGVPLNEQERILALHALNILDTPPEERFDCIARIATYLFQVPIARQFQQQELDLLYDLAQMVEREINLTHTQITISPQWQQSHRFRARFDDATISMTLLNTI